MGAVRLAGSLRPSGALVLALALPACADGEIGEPLGDLAGAEGGGGGEASGAGASGPFVDRRPGDVFFETSFEPDEDVGAELLEASGVEGAACAGVEEAFARSGKGLFAYKGEDDGSPSPRAVCALADVAVPVLPNTVLSYWVRPRDAGGAFVAVDLLFDDGTTLGESGAKDARGCPAGAGEGHCGALAEKAWVGIEVPLGKWAAGRTIERVLLVHDGPGEAGSYSGHVDDVFLGDDVEACEEPAEAAEVSPESVVIPVFLAAKDAPAEDVEDSRQAYERMLAAIQAWYEEHMVPPGERLTFGFEPVRVLDSAYSRAEWDDFGIRGFLYPDGTRSEEGTGRCGMWHAARYELREGGLLAGAGLPELGAPGVLYYAVGGGGTNGSCGAADYLGASERKLLDLVRSHCPNGRYVDACARDCRAVGAVAHELGHGFGLPHGSDWEAAADRDKCAGKSLMDIWWEYDKKATLCEPDRKVLRASGYFEAAAP